MIERLQQARESIEEGKLLFQEKIGNKAVLAKYYHAMMGCLFALFDIRDLRSLTHADIIERFEREYVRTGKADALFLKVLRRAYDLTHECDCEHMPVPTDEEIGAAREAAEGLIRMVEGLLRAEVKVNEGGSV
jgi:uncharacterized protein (UPF0332 family)